MPTRSPRPPALAGARDAADHPFCSPRRPGHPTPCSLHLCPTLAAETSHGLPATPAAPRLAIRRLRTGAPLRRGQDNVIRDPPRMSASIEPSPFFPVLLLLPHPPAEFARIEPRSLQIALHMIQLMARPAGFVIRCRGRSGLSRTYSCSFSRIRLCLRVCYLFYLIMLISEAFS